MEYNNVFYFWNINVIGGVETFFYYLAKKYGMYDITIIYSKGDINQVKRLRKYVNVKKYAGEKIKCKKIFFNYNETIIDNVEAEEYIKIIHSIYTGTKAELDGLNPKITKYIGVSKAVCKAFKEVTGLDCELCYNPVAIDDPKNPLLLVSATRLTEEKGKDLMERLGHLLNEAGVNYLWLVFTDDKNAINNPNIIYMKPCLNVIDYIKKADFLVQLSYREAFNFTAVESLLVGTPVIATNLPVYKEIGLNKDNSILLNFDFDTISVKDLYKEYKFDYQPPKDNWDKLLVKVKSKYKEEKAKRYRVKARNNYELYHLADAELGFVPEPGYEWEVDQYRLEYLLGDLSDSERFVDIVEEIK